MYLHLFIRIGSFETNDNKRGKETSVTASIHTWWGGV